MKSLRHYCLSLLLAALCLCGSASLTAQTTDPTIRAVQMVDDAPAADIYFDNVQPAAIRNLGFPDASNVLTFAAGSHNVKVAPAGQPINFSLIDTTIALNADTAYTFLATGRISTLDVDAVMLTRHKELTSPPGSTLVRFLHAAKGSGQFLVSIIDIAGSTTETPQLRFRNSIPYQAIPSGNMRVVVRSSGGDTIYDASGVLPQNALITLIAAGDTATGSFKIYVLTDSHAGTLSPLDTLRAVVNTEQGKLRFSHFLYGAPGGLDVFFDDESTPTVSNLSFSSASRAATYESGVRRVRISTVGGSPDDAIIDQEVEVIGGLSRSGIVMGDLTNQSQSLMLLTADATSTPGQGRSMVRIVNGYFDDTLVDVNVFFADGSSRAIANSGFGGFTQYESAYPGTATVTLTRPGQTQAFLTVSGEIPVDSIFTLIIAPDRLTNEYRVYILNDGQVDGQDPIRMFTGESGVSNRSVRGALSVMPNPASDRATLRFSLAKSAILSVTILTHLGERIDAFDIGRMEAGDHARALDLDRLTSGTYLVVVSDANGIVGIDRIVIAR